MVVHRRAIMTDPPIAVADELRFGRGEAAAYRAASAPQRVEIGAGRKGAEIWNGYRAMIAGLFDATLPSGAVADDFGHHSVIWQGVHASLHHTIGSAHDLYRGSEQLALGADQIMIYAQIAGQVDYRAGDSLGRIRPGDVMIYDHTRALDSVASDFENVVLILDRDVVPLALLSPQAHCLHLTAGTGLAAVIHAGLAALEASAERLGAGAFEAVALAIAAVAAEPVRAEIERDEDARASEASRLRIKAAAFIDAHISDRTLRPIRIGTHLGLSRSALYRLFEPYGGVRMVIMNRRLDRAVRVLLDDPDSHRALGEVALRHGFPTLAHFSRLFSDRFGTPPSQYCSLVQASGTEWLAAQFERTRFPMGLSAAWQDLGARRVPR